MAQRSKAKMQVASLLLFLMVCSMVPSGVLGCSFWMHVSVIMPHQVLCLPLLPPLCKLYVDFHARSRLTVAHSGACMLCCAAEFHVLVAKWAATNPVALYGLSELACRTPCALGLALAALWFKAPDAWALVRQQIDPQQQEQEPQQQRSQRWQQQQAQQQQQQQAFLNTWPEYKGYISAAASWCKAYVKVFPDVCEAALRGDYRQYSTLSETLGFMLQGNEAVGASCLGLGQAPGSSSPTLQAVRLVLLLWLARAALGVMKWCLQAAASQHSSGSNSREGSSSSSASSGAYAGACGPAETSSSSSSANAGVAVVHRSMVAWTVPVLRALVMWQKTTSELTTIGTTAAPLSGAAAEADVSCHTTRKRLSKLTVQGLPEAVTTQLVKCTTILRGCLASSASGAAEELTEPPLQSMLDGIVGDCVEGLQELGRELVVLFELLLEEVPSPLGCNFPGCSNLSGFTEADEAGSVCTRCQEARYCSMQCQVDHWEQHKRVCRRLRKQAEAAAAAGGRKMQAAKGGRTGGGAADRVIKASEKGIA